MRLFVALYPPPEVVSDMTAQVARLRVGAMADRGGDVRLVPGPTMHLTLAFLGEVAVDQLPATRAALGRASDSWRAVRNASISHNDTGPAGPLAGAGPPRIRLGGGGQFGRDRCAVLWVGLRGEADAVTTLAGAIRVELRLAGLPHDSRPFQPHLTLARPGERMDRSAVAADRSTLDGYLGPSWPVTEMLLMRSVPGRSVDHERLDSWPL